MRKSKGVRRCRLSVEELEPRKLLSDGLPDYTLKYFADGVTPFNSSSPTSFSPSQIRHAYGFDQIVLPNGASPDGTGTTIAIVDAYDDPNIVNDLHQFDLQFGLTDPPSFTKLDQTGGTGYPAANGGWAVEIALDVQWAHAMAPGANILLVEANTNSLSNLLAAVQTAARQPGVVVVSMSWGSPEFSSEKFLDNTYFSTPSGHTPVSFVASSGDNGAPVSWPATSPNVLTVGGTNLTLAGNGNYQSESGWSGSGGGISTYELQPSYQNGTVTQTSTQRANPDVAYNSDPATGFPIYDTYNNPVSAPWSQVGGTSAAAPQWASLVAIADQGLALQGQSALAGLTGLMPKIYQLAASDFHDVTTGGSTGTPNYSAGTGYDLVTGRGSPYADRVIADLINYHPSPYVGTDTAGQGNWFGSYGANGYNILGDSVSYPSYATVSTTGANSFVWATSTASDPRTLQKASDHTDRVAGCWYGSNITIDINITDGNSHRVALYLVDYDGGGRSEQIQVINVATGQVQDTRTVSSFAGGTYVVWNLSGHVQLQITVVAGPNAVVSGLFFDPSGALPTHTSGTATFQSTDTTSQGSWQGVYGGDGSNVIGDTSSYPSYAQIGVYPGAGVTNYNLAGAVWAGSSTDPRAVQKASSPSSRIAASWYATTFTVDISFTDGNGHRLAVYLLDWDARGRAERVDVLDAVTGQTLNSQTVSSFTNGTYLVWNLTGHVQLKFTATAGPNAVLSGLFFGAPGSLPAPTGTATFLSSDTATHGSWAGAYGGQGSNVIGDSSNYPSYAQVTTSGASSYCWAGSVGDPRATQRASAPTARVAACWFGSTFTIDLNLTDASTHRVAVYLLDWDNGNRSERVDIVDAATNQVLNSQTASGFSSGTYLSWTLSGHVQLRFTTLGGANSVLSGLFFGPAGAPPAPTGTASFLISDATTKGTWQGNYGGDGTNVLGDTTAYPSYAQVSFSGNGNYTWAAASADPRAPQKASSPTARVAACSYGTSFTVDINFTDANVHRVAVYLLDWDNGGRSETVSVIDAGTNQVLNAQTASGFGGGLYLSWNLTGHVQLRFASLAGPNAVLSGLFFGPGNQSAQPAASTVQFLATDTTTQGNWQGSYGADGKNIIGDTATYPSYAQVNPIGANGYTWAGSTSAARALHKASNPADSIAGCWYGDTFTIDINFSDSNTHRLALYLLDWDFGNRSEQIDILDAATGQVLNSQTASSFSAGKYLSWNVSGHIQVRITSLSGPNAVLSGLFFG